jgi:hypothetical protein
MIDRKMTKHYFDIANETLDHDAAVMIRRHAAIGYVARVTHATSSV